MAEKQYVIFRLGNEEYGIDIVNVREITVFKQTTKVPNAPDYIDGIINLRGTVIPVINLKKRLNFNNANNVENSRIIIVAMKEKLVGFVVDEASQVITLKEEEIENPPEIIAGAERKYIVGIGKTNEKIIILLDLVDLFTAEEKREIEGIEVY